MLAPLSPSRIDAKEDVITTLLTVGALFLIDFSMPTYQVSVKYNQHNPYDSNSPVVPMMAGSNRSFLVSVTLKRNYINLVEVQEHLKMD